MTPFHYTPPRPETPAKVNDTTFYLVVDGKQPQGQRKPLSTHRTRAQASRKVDRLDNEYGAYRYRVIPPGFTY